MPQRAADPPAAAEVPELDPSFEASGTERRERPAVGAQRARLLAHAERRDDRRADRLSGPRVVELDLAALDDRDRAPVRTDDGVASGNCRDRPPELAAAPNVPAPDRVVETGRDERSAVARER